MPVTENKPNIPRHPIAKGLKRFGLLLGFCLLRIGTPWFIVLTFYRTN
jgi:hypothetical protein